MTFPLDEARTTGDSAADHVSDHNLVHDYVNALNAAWTAFDCNFSDGTGDIGMGSGGVEDTYYMQVGRLVVARYYFAFGSSPSTGSGDWRMDLPVAANSGHLASLSGFIVGAENGVAWRFGVANYVNVANKIQPFTLGGQVWGPTQPHTWGEDDFFGFSLVYEASTAATT